MQHTFNSPSIPQSRGKAFPRNGARSFPRSRRLAHRGFNLVEMLIALAISAALLTATMAALDASFHAYQSTTEVASTHTIGRLIMHRVLTLIRTGSEFGPFPANPLDTIVESEFIEFRTPPSAAYPVGQIMVIEWVEADEALYVDVDGEQYLLLEGVVAQTDPNTGLQVPPFTLEFERGRILHRATLDLAIVPDDNLSTVMDGDNQQVIRLVGSAMPRVSTY